MNLTIDTAGERAALLTRLKELGSWIPVRDLIGHWGAKGRGTQVVQAINAELLALDLTSEPPFEYGSLDNLVRVVPLDGAESVARRGASQDSPSPLIGSAASGGHLLHVGQIPSALGGVFSVASEDTIQSAQTVMIRYDFSQLAVIDEGVLVGAVSWETIAQATLRSSVSTVGECMESPRTISQDADLLASITTIIDSNYVVVVGPDGKPTGIITTADLAGQFDRLARPFLLVGECELELKRLLDRHFSAEQLLRATRYKNAEKSGASAMTIGDIKQFVAKADNWNSIGLRLSHDVFIDWLEQIRLVRNDIAHFNQDEDLGLILDQIRNLTLFLRSL